MTRQLYNLFPRNRIVHVPASRANHSDPIKPPEGHRQAVNVSSAVHLLAATFCREDPSSKSAAQELMALILSTEAIYGDLRRGLAFCHPAVMSNPLDLLAVPRNHQIYLKWSIFSGNDVGPS